MVNHIFSFPLSLSITVPFCSPPTAILSLFYIKLVPRLISYGDVLPSTIGYTEKNPSAQGEAHCPCDFFSPTEDMLRNINISFDRIHWGLKFNKCLCQHSSKLPPTANTWNVNIHIWMHICMLSWGIVVDENSILRLGNNIQKTFNLLQETMQGRKC